MASIGSRSPTEPSPEKPHDPSRMPCSKDVSDPERVSPQANPRLESQLAAGVRVDPGWIKTAMDMQNREQTPNKTASMVEVDRAS
jgi:hypothetical protein